MLGGSKQRKVYQFNDDDVAEPVEVVDETSDMFAHLKARKPSDRNRTPTEAPAIVSRRSMSPSVTRRPVSPSSARRSTTPTELRRPISPSSTRRPASAVPFPTRQTLSMPHQPQSSKQPRRMTPSEEAGARLYRLAQLSQDRKDEIAKRVKEEDAKTFQYITQKSKSLMVDRFGQVETPVSASSYGELLYEESKMKRELREREREAIQQWLERQREEEVLDNLTFKPRINPRSARLASVPPEAKASDVFSRLYDVRSPAVARAVSPRQIRRGVVDTESSVHHDATPEKSTPEKVTPTRSVTMRAASAAELHRPSVMTTPTTASATRAPRPPVTPVVTKTPSRTNVTASARKIPASPKTDALSSTNSSLELTGPSGSIPLSRGPSRKGISSSGPSLSSASSTPLSAKNSRSNISQKIPPLALDDMKHTPPSPVVESREQTPSEPLVAPVEEEVKEPTPRAPTPPPPPPQLPAVTSISIEGKPEEDATLTANATVERASLDDCVFTWFRSGVADPVATSKTYKLTKDDIGRSLRVLCVPKTGGEGATSEPTADVVAGQPRALKVDIIGGTTHTSLLRCNPTYFGGEPGKSTIRWQKSLDGASWVFVPNGTEASLQLSLDDIDHIFRVTYTPVRNDDIVGTPVTTVTKKITLDENTNTLLKPVMALPGGTWNVTYKGEVHQIELGDKKVKLKKGKKTIYKAAYPEIIAGGKSISLDGRDSFSMTLEKNVCHMTATSADERDVIVWALRRIASSQSAVKK